MHTSENKFGYLETRSTATAAALLAQGCDLANLEMPIAAYIDENGKEIYTFRFENTPLAQQIMAAFAREEEYYKQSPNDNISAMLCYKNNYTRLMDYIKQVPKRCIVRRGGKIYLIPLPPTDTKNG